MTTPFHSLLAWHYEHGIDSTIAIPQGDQPSLMPPMNKSEALNTLRQEMEAFEGCLLSKTAQHTVFGDGSPDAELMFVGEAPGAEEDRLGKPFVGMSGKLLNNMLIALGLERSQVYITNVVPWRPPFNRQPTTEEVALCLPFIERHISIIQPKILVCVGGVACKALLRSTESMTVLQRKPLLYSSPLLLHPITTFALYHPAYLLRFPGQKRSAWLQLLNIRKVLDSQS